MAEISPLASAASPIRVFLSFGSRAVPIQLPSSSRNFSIHDLLIFLETNSPFSIARQQLFFGTEEVDLTNSKLAHRLLSELDIRPWESIVILKVVERVSLSSANLSQLSPPAVLTDDIRELLDDLQSVESLDIDDPLSPSIEGQVRIYNSNELIPPFVESLRPVVSRPPPIRVSTDSMQHEIVPSRIPLRDQTERCFDETIRMNASTEERSRNPQDRAGESDLHDGDDDGNQKIKQIELLRKKRLEQQAAVAIVSPPRSPMENIYSMTSTSIDSSPLKYAISDSVHEPSHHFFTTSTSGFSTTNNGQIITTPPSNSSELNARKEFLDVKSDSLVNHSPSDHEKQVSLEGKPAIPIDVLLNMSSAYVTSPSSRFSFPPLSSSDFHSPTIGQHVMNSHDALNIPSVAAIQGSDSNSDQVRSPHRSRFSSRGDEFFLESFEAPDRTFSGKVSEMEIPRGIGGEAVIITSQLVDAGLVDRDFLYHMDSSMRAFERESMELESKKFDVGQLARIQHIRESFMPLSELQSPRIEESSTTHCTTALSRVKRSSHSSSSSRFSYRISASAPSLAVGEKDYLEPNHSTVPNSSLFEAPTLLEMSTTLSPSSVDEQISVYPSVPNLSPIQNSSLRSEEILFENDASILSQSVSDDISQARPLVKGSDSSELPAQHDLYSMDISFSNGKTERFKSESMDQVKKQTKSESQQYFVGKQAKPTLSSPTGSWGDGFHVGDIDVTSSPTFSTSSSSVTSGVQEISPGFRFVSTIESEAEECSRSSESFVLPTDFFSSSLSKIAIQEEVGKIRNLQFGYSSPDHLFPLVQKDPFSSLSPSPRSGRDPPSDFIRLRIHPFTPLIGEELPRFSLYVDLDVTVHDLKIAIFEAMLLTEVSPNRSIRTISSVDQRLMFPHPSDSLADGTPLSDCGVKDRSIIFVGVDTYRRVTPPAFIQVTCKTAWDGKSYQIQARPLISVLSFKREICESLCPSPTVLPTDVSLVLFSYGCHVPLVDSLTLDHYFIDKGHIIYASYVEQFKRLSF